jgi:hypothetical protein
MVFPGFPSIRCSHAGDVQHHLISNDNDGDGDWLGGRYWYGVPRSTKMGNTRSPYPYDA